MHIVVTGAAGFIGSNIVKGLNMRGEARIVAVDNLARSEKFTNLVDCEIGEYFESDDFLARLENGEFDGDLAAVLHQGACSDTMQTDGRYMMSNNYRYSARLLNYCQVHELPFLYASSASVYGNGTTFVESRPNESPINIYGYSKFLFDQYVRGVLPNRTAQIAGFRYFNVYGPREAHKGRMASVVWHFFNQYRAEGRVRLFEGSGGYAAGEQRRDFVHVDDVVAVNMHFLDDPECCGIFNVGSGRATSYNEVAAATINAIRASAGEPARSPRELAEAGAIAYVPFPEGLRGRYQSFTQADLSQLRSIGYEAETTTVAQGVGRYVGFLLEGQVNP